VSQRGLSDADGKVRLAGSRGACLHGQNPAEFAVPEIAGQFAAASLPKPNINRVVICHGFACKFRTVIAFGPKDHAELRKIMAKVTSPEAERVAVARAVAWYERRIAPEAGTAGAKARSTRREIRRRLTASNPH
jgi:hypothetical protein